MAESSAASAVVTAPTKRTDASSSFHAWLLQKLRLEWSSSDLGGLLTTSKLAEARASFPYLETPMKVRDLSGRTYAFVGRYAQVVPNDHVLFTVHRSVCCCRC